MRAFPVRLPSGVRYWTVLDEELAVVAVADQFLRQVRFGRDGAESTTKAYANGIALFLRWCARSGRSWQAGVEQLGLFMTWLAHAGRRFRVSMRRRLEGRCWPGRGRLAFAGRGGSTRCCARYGLW